MNVYFCYALGQHKGIGDLYSRDQSHTSNLNHTVCTNLYLTSIHNLSLTAWQEDNDEQHGDGHQEDNWQL